MGRRVLTDGLEITTVLPLHEDLDVGDVLTLASGLSAAAGSPWGDVFPSSDKTTASDGSFNGLWVSATMQGVRYILGPPEDPPAIGEAIEKRHRGGYLLMLSREDDGDAFGLVALRRRASGEMEITAVLPLNEEVDATGVLELARDLSLAAGFSVGRSGSLPPLFPSILRQPRAASTVCGRSPRWKDAATRSVHRKTRLPSVKPSSAGTREAICWRCLARTTCSRSAS